MLRIGRFVPWLIGLGLLLDGATRLVPLDNFSFRAWETLVVRRGPTGPFEPNRTYVNPLTHGDLSRSQRYRNLRQHHLEYFSTDPWGFRNTSPAFADQPVRWLLVGDSFGVSSGVTDGNSLAGQIAQASGQRAYNASADRVMPLADIRFTAGRLGMTDGVVVYEFTERTDMPAIDGSARMFSDGPPGGSGGLAERYRVWSKDASVDRMSIVAAWGWDALATKLGSVGSDAGATAAMEVATSAYRLTSGATMLFYSADVDATEDPSRRIGADYLAWLAPELQKAGLRLAVLLVPSKYSVYGPLVSDPAAPRPSALPLERLADDLTTRGVLTVNVTAALRQAAADDLRRGEYVYFPDDTHWNERGIAIAARAMTEAWKGQKNLAVMSKSR